MEHFVELIPLDSPQLANKLFTKMFKYFIQSQNFKAFLCLMDRTPKHLVNSDVLIEVMDNVLDKNHKLESKPEILEIQYRLYQSS